MWLRTIEDLLHLLGGINVSLSIALGVKELATLNLDLEKASGALGPLSSLQTHQVHQGLCGYWRANLNARHRGRALTTTTSPANFDLMAAEEAPGMHRSAGCGRTSQVANLQRWRGPGLTILYCLELAVVTSGTLHSNIADVNKRIARSVIALQ